MWKRVCEAWYSVAPYVLEDVHQLNGKEKLQKIEKGGATKHQLHDLGVQICCCVFIKMY